MTRSTYDVAVVGLGAVGSAALYQLSRRGAHVIGLDRFRPPHDRGSSHGESRITRQAIGEGETYVPLVLRSNEIWDELAGNTGRHLIERCGFIFITRDDAGTSHHGKAGFLGRTLAAAQRFGIEHEILEGADIGRRFPQFCGLVGDEAAYFEPGGGYLRPEECITASIEEARRLGATIAFDSPVQQLIRRPTDTVLRIPSRDIIARNVILAPGSWIGSLAPKLGRHVSIHKQTLHWFQVDDTRFYNKAASPTFIWTHGLTDVDQFYGFPPIDGLVKVAREEFAASFDPDQADRNADPADAEAMAARHVRGHLAGLGASPVRSSICHYAVAADNDFVVEIDSDFTLQAISACSGHGFKHAAALGEALARQVCDQNIVSDLKPFLVDRFSRSEAAS